MEDGVDECCRQQIHKSFPLFISFFPTLKNKTQNHPKLFDGCYTPAPWPVLNDCPFYLRFHYSVSASGALNNPLCAPADCGKYQCSLCPSEECRMLVVLIPIELSRRVQTSSALYHWWKTWGRVGVHLFSVDEVGSPPMLSVIRWQILLSLLRNIPFHCRNAEKPFKQFSKVQPMVKALHPLRHHVSTEVKMPSLLFFQPSDTPFTTCLLLFFRFISQRPPVSKSPARTRKEIVCICWLSGAFQRHDEPRNGNLTSVRPRWPEEKKPKRSLRKSGNGSTMMKIMMGSKRGEICACVWIYNEVLLLLNIKLEYKERKKGRWRLCSAQTGM